MNIPKQDNCYEWSNGKYYHTLRGVTTCVGSSVAVGYTYAPNGGSIKGTMHKHGSLQLVRSWKETWDDKARGFEDTFGKTFIMHSEHWDVEELNKILNTTGFIGILHEANS